MYWNCINIQSVWLLSNLPMEIVDQSGGVTDAAPATADEAAASPLNAASQAASLPASSVAAFGSPIWDLPWQHPGSTQVPWAQSGSDCAREVLASCRA